MTKRGLIDLSQNDLQLVREILLHHIPGESVYVFGSRATGRTRYLSDLDLLLDRQEPMDRMKMYDLLEAFDESDLPIEVDVVDLSTVTETFRTRVMAESIPFPMVPESTPAEQKVYA